MFDFQRSDKDAGYGKRCRELASSSLKFEVGRSSHRVGVLGVRVDGLSCLGELFRLIGGVRLGFFFEDVGEVGFSVFCEFFIAPYSAELDSGGFDFTGDAGCAGVDA